MKGKLLTILKYTILLGVAAALLLYALRGMDVKKIIQQIFQSTYLGFCVRVDFTYCFCCSCPQMELADRTHGVLPSLKNTTYAVLVGYFANLALAKIRRSFTAVP
jgi:hypothetical protein